MAHLDIKKRSATDDLSEVDGLLRRVERADGVRPLSDHLWIDLRQGGRPGFAGLLAYTSLLTARFLAATIRGHLT